MPYRILIVLTLLTATASTQVSAPPNLQSRLVKISAREYVDLRQITYFQIAAGPNGAPGGGLIIVGGHPDGLTPEATGTLYAFFEAGQLPQLTAFSAGELYDVSQIRSFRLPTATVFTNRWGEEIDVGGWVTDPTVQAENYLRRMMGLPEASY